MLHICFIQNMRSDATTMQLGDHLREEQELPNIPPEAPPLVRADAAEWKPEELPITPTKTSLLPPVSWLVATEPEHVDEGSEDDEESEKDSVSLEVKDEDDSDHEPLMRGVGAVEFLRANGVQLGHEESTGADQDDTNAAPCKAVGHEDDAMGVEECHEREATQHYSPAAEPAGREEDEPENDEDVPLLHHASQAALRGKKTKKKQGDAVEPTAKPSAKATAKTKAKAKAKTKSAPKAKAKNGEKKSTANPKEPDDAEEVAPPKKKGWPKGKAKAKSMKKPAAANMGAKRKHADDREKDPQMQEDENEKEKEEQHEEKEPREPQEDEEAQESPQSKRPKKGVCRVTSEQKKHLKSSLGNIRLSMCACMQVCLLCLC